MEVEELTSSVKTCPHMTPEEQEMAINFVKVQEQASVYTTIASQVKRLFQHSDVSVENISVYNPDSEGYKWVSLDEYEPKDEDIIFGAGGKVPIESLKIQSSPRSQRSYAAIISPQSEVNIE